VRLLADSNIVARAVLALRDAGHDVVYVGERAADPGDQALLAEAATAGRILVTKDHDIGGDGGRGAPSGREPAPPLRRNSPPRSGPEDLPPRR